MCRMVRFFQPGRSITAIPIAELIRKVHFVTFGKAIGRLGILLICPIQPVLSVSLLILCVIKRNLDGI